MIASAFAYYNYRFSEYKFIDFSEWIFYQKSELFQPTSDQYTVLVLSSNKDDIKALLPKITTEHPVLVVDLYQKREASSSQVQYVSAGMNTLLPFVHRFGIYEIPSVFEITIERDLLYKQNSPLRTIR
ncbi:hypothetical protein JWV37_04250 [Sulfurospirillum sp. T05]|uniref:Uncharacterized protein n=1 Tax=Sulfurospirillum tamanense TaxID=2813362 RepID=A0ABS2WQT1_9BACT|nr:hypothetical protein [Sulfurospirillum tamanensis]MBN2963985.1 hypothetical protein [Sulfurospirillum tamanensis]